MRRRPHLCLIASLLSSLYLFTSQAQAQGSYVAFGSGCPGTNGRPVLTPLLPPRIGRPFSILLSNIPSYGGMLFWGISNIYVGVIFLPFSLFSLGMFGCFLLVF